MITPQSELSEKAVTQKNIVAAIVANVATKRMWLDTTALNNDNAYWKKSILVENRLLQ